VARRQPVAEGEKNRWTYYEKTVPLLVEVLDIEARKIPDGFKLKQLPGQSPQKKLPVPDAPKSSEDSNMEASGPPVPY
jgi:hypothetical protein